MCVWSWGQLDDRFTGSNTKQSLPLSLLYIKCIAMFSLSGYQATTLTFSFWYDGCCDLPLALEDFLKTKRSSDWQSFTETSRVACFCAHIPIFTFRLEGAKCKIWTWTVVSSETHFVTHGSASVILGFDRKQKQVDSFKNSSHIQ